MESNSLNYQKEVFRAKQEQAAMSAGYQAITSMRWYFNKSKSHKGDIEYLEKIAELKLIRDECDLSIEVIYFLERVISRMKLHENLGYIRNGRFIQMPISMCAMYGLMNGSIMAKKWVIVTRTFASELLKDEFSVDIPRIAVFSKGCLLFKSYYYEHIGTKILGLSKRAIKKYRLEEVLEKTLKKIRSGDVTL